MNHKYIPPIQTRFLDFRLVCSANCLITVSTRMPNQYHTLNMTKKKNCLLYICSTSNLCCTFPISENNCSNLLTLEPVLTAFFPCISPPIHSQVHPIHLLIQYLCISFPSTAFILRFGPRCHFLLLNYHRSFLTSLSAAPRSPYFQLRG